jgi:hypothetical protein
MFHEDEQRAWLFRQLSASLQALALAGSEQRLLFPEWIPKPTELAMHFDHWLSAIREHQAADLSPAETEALAALERKLTTMSRDGAEFDADLWTETAVADSPHWEEVRRLAAAALNSIGDWRLRIAD